MEWVGIQSFDFFTLHDPKSPPVVFMKLFTLCTFSSGIKVSLTVGLIWLWASTEVVLEDTDGCPCGEVELRRFPFVNAFGGFRPS